MNLAKRLALLLAVPLAALVPLGVILHLQLRTIEERGKYVVDLQVPSLAIRKEKSPARIIRRSTRQSTASRSVSTLAGAPRFSTVSFSSARCTMR